jgi:type I restriction enzyme S subunit
MLCDKLYRLAPTRSMNPEFLVMALGSREVRDQIEVATTGASGSMQNISQQVIRSLLVPNCDLVHQANLVEQIHRIRVVHRSTSEEIAAIQSELVEYRDALITEAVTGQLDVARPSDGQMEESLDAVRLGERPEVLAS